MSCLEETPLGARSRGKYLLGMFPLRAAIFITVLGVYSFEAPCLASPASAREVDGELLSRFPLHSSREDAP